MKTLFIVIMLALSGALFGAFDSHAAQNALKAPSAADYSVTAEAVSAGNAAAPVLKPEDYPKVRGVNSRLAVWFAAQMHLWFAAFVLAVPIFVLIIEIAGVVKKDARLDAMAHEFIRISAAAHTLAVTTGVLLLLGLIAFYPAVLKYLALVLKGTIPFYIALVLVDIAALYAYCYLWSRMKDGILKKAHIALGVMLNLSGTAIMFIANAWVTFMMTPAGVDKFGALKNGAWQAINNPLWSPMNLHRLIANVAYGASIVGAYAAYMFLSAPTAREKAHYDWMGYTASFISIAALMPLPFAGYWLTAEIYRFSQQMGITLMGGEFARLFIIQAVMIGALFLSANYYLWCGTYRCAVGHKYGGWIKYIAVALFLSFLVWFTPHTLASEGGAVALPYHKFLGPLGLMPAKNTAVNIMLLSTYLSFFVYRRAVKEAVASSAVNAVQAGLFLAGISNILFLGAYYGYFTNTAYKVASSVPQVLTTALVIIVSVLIERFAVKGRAGASVNWGTQPSRSQWALILLAVSFTWLMGLMGYVRSAIRQNWHVYSIMKDSSGDAFTPSIAYAAKVTSVGTIIFMALIVIIFRISRLGGSGDEKFH